MAKGKRKGSGWALGVTGFIILAIGLGLLIGLYLGITKKIKDAKSNTSNKQKFKLKINLSKKKKKKLSQYNITI